MRDMERERCCEKRKNVYRYLSLFPSVLYRDRILAIEKRRRRMGTEMRVRRGRKDCAAKRRLRLTKAASTWETTFTIEYEERDE